MKELAPFYKWFKSASIINQAIAVITLIVFILTIVGVLLVYYGVSNIQLGKFPLLFSFIFQILILFLMVACPINKSIEDDDNNGKMGHKSITYVCKQWHNLLISWIILYSVFLVFQILKMKYSDPSSQQSIGDIEPIIKNSINNMSTLFLFYLYSSLSYPYEDKYLPKIANKRRFWAALLFVWLVVETLITVFVADPNISDGFKWISGIMSGIGMAFLVGRMHSVLIRPPGSIMFLLYSYAIVQPVFAVFSKQKAYEIFFVNYALFLKAIVYIILIWFIEEKKYFSYYEQVDNVYFPKNSSESNGLALDYHQLSLPKDEQFIEP